MRYIHYFETTSAFTEAYNNEYVEPWVSYTEENQEVNYNKPPHDYSQDYLTFEILSDGIINWKITYGNNWPLTISYSKNNGEWTSITSTTGGTAISVETGDIIRFKGNNDTYDDEVEYYTQNGFSVTTCGFNVYGNIMSLIYGDNYQNQTTFPQNSTYNFAYLFSECTSLVNAINLILPATTLTQSCYKSMFIGCTNLTTAPILPATALTGGCYEGMFEGCTSLTNAPELPVTTLANDCYSNMFRNCTSLETAPELPATTLAPICYSYMFYKCTSLNYIKCLASDISANDCTNNWLDDVSASGTFVKHPDMNDWTTGGSGIPEGWTVQDAS